MNKYPKILSLTLKQALCAAEKAPLQTPFSTASYTKFIASNSMARTCAKPNSKLVTKAPKTDNQKLRHCSR